MLKKNKIIRELNKEELKSVSGGIGIYGGWTASGGWHGGIYLGKRPGKG